MEFVQENIAWIMLAVVSGGMLLWQTVRGAADSVSVTEATVLLNREEAVVIDVRETHEWSAGHIPDAHHIALAQVEKRLSELEKFKAKPLIVCCASGNRSTAACRTLKKAGFERVFNLAGGIGAWTEAGLPVSTKS